MYDAWAAILMCSTCEYERYKAYKERYSDEPACAGTVGTAFCVCLIQMTGDRTRGPRQ